MITDESPSFNADWRAVWRVAARRVKEGWSAEFAIPFRSLRYPARGGPWGFNVYRVPGAFLKCRGIILFPLPDR